MHIPAPESNDVLADVALPEGGDPSWVRFRYRVDDRVCQGVVVRRGESLYAYQSRCPHWNLPLDHASDDILSSDGEHLVCSVHGALFEIATGRCVGGPCLGAGLYPLRCEATPEGVRVFDRSPAGIGRGGVA
jgi:nitrite reductase/ring-hydroxylating ferredoxin subunit